MKAFSIKVLVMLALWAAQPATGSQFTVVSAIGVAEPAGLQSGQQLAAGTRIELEPWGRVLIRESAACEIAHVVVGLNEYVLAVSDNCSNTEDPMAVVGRIQQGETFAGRLDGASAGPAADVIAALSHDACVYLPRFSEEDDGGRRCPSGFALNGLRCTGSFCDNKDLMCCPYLQGAPDPTSKQAQARQISEEFPNTMTSKRFLNGMTCFDAYCDNVLPHAFKSSQLTVTKTCDWSPWDSDRPSTWLVCGAGRFVAGLRCRGDYCADVGIYCCQAQLK